MLDIILPVSVLLKYYKVYDVGILYVYNSYFMCKW